MQLSLLIGASLVALVEGAPGAQLQQHEARATASGSASYNPPIPTNIKPNACAQVSKLSRAFARTAAAEATPTVPAGKLNGILNTIYVLSLNAAIAYECINSVPFEIGPAVELMDSIRPYINWQTTLQYVKEPPAE